jgi:DNA-binding protein H-NS
MDKQLKAMSTDELWQLHERLTELLGSRIREEKARLEEKLDRLAGPNVVKLEGKHRPYPPVLPKYQNPSNPTETWAGRGRMPRWVRAELRAGKKLDDLRIGRKAS